MDERAKYRYLAEINSTFTPGSPIDSRDLFAGRTKQVEKVISTIFQKGSHAILFGERGVGKTSLANTLFDFLVMTGKYNYQRAKVNCSEGMSFTDIWRVAFSDLVFTTPDGSSLKLVESLPENPGPEDIRMTFQLVDDPSIIIIDELDRISNANVTVLLADTIKTLSDNAIKTTLILVGVADAVDELIGEHPSIERPLKQIHMQRMSKPELLEIVDKGLAKIEGVSIEPLARARMADLAQGLPFYTHMLARESSLNAVMSERGKITMQDLEVGIREAVTTHGETNLTTYNEAVTAPRGKYFKPVLLACALAEKDEKGFFYASNIVAPLQLITGKPLDIPAFAQHLKDFSESRGPILEREGRRYRFRKPLMGPYVILRGLADKLIVESQLSHPAETSLEPEQLSLLSPSAESLEIH
jgi:AAA domain-containing protein